MSLTLVYATPTIKSTNQADLQHLEGCQKNSILNPNEIRSIGGDDYWIVASKGNPILQRERFIKYLTHSWAKADNYSYSKTVSYSWSLSGNYEPSMISTLSFNFTRSQSKSHSIGTSIPADKNRYSKLGFAADYNKYSATMKYIDFLTARTIKTVHGVVIQEPTDDTYLLVVYK